MKIQKIIYMLIAVFIIACSSNDNEVINNPTDKVEDKPNEEFVLKGEEKKLYDLIMAYRKEHNLPSIPVSKSLNFVAQTHVSDLENNQPTGGNCNLHSWSDKGDWSACCYTSDHAKAKCMWDKPKELTNYQANGYEISFGAKGFVATAQNSLAAWKKSKGHNDVILNLGIWDSTWNAIGVGIKGGYAVVWFGNKKDTNQ